ncbi:methyltransferase family protein [Natronocalculus amylovorans]|uniref:Isoprenylcysteine carboxylmethyltransferase family protein n=1 Tax=Natronocalculus amylovorans TaxID=2917812 RepID=A0AAE3FWC6_9EURY|nr:isoprenylcysteine carboxylmethyltransferase family protein [Natronocalculus amylovorans]MCL9815854.1 isoprenylcysteine carboxylmethyltransferase family protein [Natronocalculus amylovorans]
MSRNTLTNTAIFSLLVPGTVAGAIPHLLATYDRESTIFSHPLVRVCGRLLFAIGLLLYLYTAWLFVKDGDGTPSPTHETTELVTSGIYQYTRNPMYIAVLLLIGGQAVRYRSVHICWWLLVCALGFHRRVIEYEEPHLFELHGEAYEQYCETVPRWLPTPSEAKQ